MQMQAHNIFPIPMLETELGREFTPEELKYISSLKHRKNVGNTISADTDILESPEMAHLKKWCHGIVNEFLQYTHRPKDGVALRITQSWVSFCEKNQYHHDHNHPNSFYSGVLYIDARHDSIKFKNPNFNLFPLFVQPKNSYTMYNADHWDIPTYTGKLIIFPSQLIHGVPIIKEDYTRISLGFNTFPTGELADKPGLWNIEL